jgi:hypothetical protein
VVQRLAAILRLSIVDGQSVFHAARVCKCIEEFAFDLRSRGRCRSGRTRRPRPRSILPWPWEISDIYEELVFEAVGRDGPVYDKQTRLGRDPTRQSRHCSPTPRCVVPALRQVRRQARRTFLELSRTSSPSPRIRERIYEIGRAPDAGAVTYKPHRLR